MGAAAYNRGSKAIREQLDREQHLPPRPESRAPIAREPKRPEWMVGDWAYCTVYQIEGWYRVTAVKDDGRIKVSGFNTWNPLHNFKHTDRKGRTYNEL